MKSKKPTKKKGSVVAKSLASKKELDKTRSKQITLLEKIIKYSLYILVCATPLWFLPFTQDILNYQKQTLMVIGGALALVVWLLKVARQEELEIRLHWLHLLVLAAVIITGISTATSLWFHGSFWGWPSNITDSFLTILFFGIVYFIVSQTVKNIQETFNLFFLFIVSSAVAAVYAMVQLYGFFLIPLAFAKLPTFNTIGSANSVAVLAAILLPLSIAGGFAFTKKMRIWLWIFSAIFLVTLLVINFFTAWLSLIAGLILFLLFAIMYGKEVQERGFISLPMALLIIALFFIVFKVALPGSPHLPVEVFPSTNSEMGIVKQVLQNNIWFGTGPGTFIFNYAKYHEAAVNNSIFFATKFNAGFSAVLNWFITRGIAGGIIFIATIIFAIVVILSDLLKTKNVDAAWLIKLGILCSLLGAALSQFIYDANFTLSFLLWLLLAAAGVATVKNKKKIILVPNSLVSISFSLVALVIALAMIGILCVAGQNYVAEMKYAKGLSLAEKGETQKAIEMVLSAANVNPLLDIYWQDLAKLYLAQANQASLVANPSGEEKKQSKDNIANATIAANRAVSVNPANVENWDVRGFVYMNLIGAAGADELAIESYNTAITLEPSSPFHLTELGRVYLAQAQNITTQKGSETKRQEALNNSLESLNKAIFLKKDYAPAHYLIALVYDQQGKTSLAMEKLEETSSMAPNDVDLAFQLGVLYYQKGRYEKAQEKLEQAKALNQNYSNARYMLGLVYDKRGEKSKAIIEFNAVLKLNPNNEQVKNILENLNNGEPALAGIQFSQPSISGGSPTEQ